jgi:WD40 repeat protein
MPPGRLGGLGPHRQAVVGHQRTATPHARRPPRCGHRCAFTPDGQRLVTDSIDHTIGVWEVGVGPPPVHLEGHTAPVWAFGLSPRGGCFLVSGGHDGTVVVWDLTAGPPSR